MNVKTRQSSEGSNCDFLYRFIYILTIFYLFSFFLRVRTNSTFTNFYATEFHVFVWLDVPAVVALDKASHDTFFVDYRSTVKS